MICGLGNPGRKYEHTRHNVGFGALDRLAEEVGTSGSRSRFHAEVREGRIGAERVILMKPTTYMNLSGQAVREAVHFYKVDPRHLLVIYDDFDIPLGTLRIRKFGSAGTHNGMRSVVQELGTDRFPRIRIGTGRKEKGDLIDFVVGQVSREEREILQAMEREAADAARLAVEEGVDLAMNRFNKKSR